MDITAAVVRQKLGLFAIENLELDDPDRMRCWSVLKAAGYAILIFMRGIGIGRSRCRPFLDTKGLASSKKLAG